MAALRPRSQALAAALATTLLAAAAGCAAQEAARHPDRPDAAATALAGPRRDAVCWLGDRLGRLDLIPSGDDGLALRIVTADPERARAAIAARWGAAPPEGITAIAIAAPRPKLAVVIDDLGLHADQLAPLWRVGAPLTWAILPRQRWTGPYERWLAARGASVLVHVPMEPTESQHMTLEGYLTLAQGAGERAALLEAHLKAQPSAVGFNNHMGSLLTTRPAVMRRLMADAPRGLVVLDSRTVPDSQLAAAARPTHPVAERSVFIDNVRDVEAILARLREAGGEATQTGAAVAIGHPYAETAQALARFAAEDGDDLHLVTIERVSAPAVLPRWLRDCP